MRLYTADLSRKFTGEAASHSAIAVTLAVAHFLGGVIQGWVTFLLVVWHVNQSRIARARSRACDSAESGYVDISPGIQVVTLREDRDREREPEQILRN